MSAMRVRDLMTANVYSLTVRDDLYAAQNLMDEHNIRHLPVVDDDVELVGLVTTRDLLRAASPRDDDLPIEMRQARMHSESIAEWMTEEVATVQPDDDLAEAARVLLENKFGCLPVVEGGRLAGILTEADFVRYFAAD